MNINPTWGPPVTAALMVVIILIFGDVIPIQIGARKPEFIASIAAPVLAVAGVLLAPLITIFLAASRGVLWLMGVRGEAARPKHITEEHLKAMIDEGRASGALDEAERRMLKRALDFGERTAGQVMTPRTDIVAIPEDATIGEAVRVGLEAGKSRLPVYSGSLDNVVGIVHLKDLLPYVREGETDQPAKLVARPALFIPETLAADEVLKRLQSQGRTIGIVKDEFGGTAGLVTVEDLVEEIVGPIQDEYDRPEEPEIRQVGPGEWVCSGQVNAFSFAEATGVELPEEGDWDTLAGFVLELAERVPEPGERFRWDGLEFVVEEMDGKRIKRLRVRRVEAAKRESEAPEGAGA